MKHSDIAALSRGMAPVIRDLIADSVRPLIAENKALLERIAALEAEKAAAPDVASMVAAEVAKLEFPQAPEPIAPDMVQIGEMIERSVSDKVSQIPPPKNGESFTLEQAQPVIDQAVKDAVAALEPPKDGVGVAGAVIDRDHNLYLTLTDGTVRDLGCVVGRDADMEAIERSIHEKIAALPTPKDGLDGFGFDDLSVEHDGERGFVLRFMKGERTKEFAFELPVVLDRGVWREGDAYKAGDACTWAGSLWIAQKDTDAKPDSGDGWRLSVKRGRDGKDKA